jgi:CDP-6-deoxy-D-xylo-4-hexulose-3-dehydrase
MNETRHANRERLTRALLDHELWDGRFELPRAGEGTTAAWFGFPCLLSAGFPVAKRAFLAHLASSGIENRPIISGNFTRQPGLRAHGLAFDPKGYPGAEAVDQRGFFIGIHTESLPESTVDQLADILLAPVPAFAGVNVSGRA